MMKSAEDWSQLSSSERYRERATRKHKRRQKRRQSASSTPTPTSTSTPTPLPDRNQEMEQDTAGPSILDDEQLFQQAVMDHALTLGMDPEVDEEFLWIAEKALTAELPPDWELGKSEDGTPYHYNVKTNESIWEHPLDEEFRQLFQRKKREKMDKAAAFVDQLNAESIEEIEVMEANDLDQEINALQLEEKTEVQPLEKPLKKSAKGSGKRMDSVINVSVERKQERLVAERATQDIVEAKQRENKFLRDRIATLESKLSATEERLNVKVKETCELENKLKAHGEELASKSKEVEILNREMTYIKETVATRESAATCLKEETNTRNERIQLENETFKQENARLKQQLAAAEIKSDTFSSTREELKREVAGLKDQLQFAQDKVSQAESRSYEVALESAANRQESFQKIVTQMEELRSRLESERDAAREKNIELEKKLLLTSQEGKKVAELEGKLKELEASHRALSAEKTKLDEALEQMQEKGDEEWQSKNAWKEDAIKAAYEDRCKTLVREKQELLAKESSQRQELQSKIATIESTNGRLRLQLQMLKEDQQERFGSNEKSLHHAQNSLEEAREEIKRLNAKLATAKTTTASWEELVRQKDEEMKKLQYLYVQLQSSQLEQSPKQPRTDASQSRVQELEGKLSGLEQRYCQELKDAVVETSKRVGIEWSENSKVQMASLRQCLAESEQTISQERLRHSLRERELVGQLDQQKASFSELLHMQKEENAKLCDMNRELLQILTSFKGQFQQTTASLVRPAVQPHVPIPVSGMSSQDEAELVKLSMQLKSLRSQCQQLNRPVYPPTTTRSTRVHYDFSPVKVSTDNEFPEEDANEHMLSMSMLKSGKGCITPERPSRFDHMERNLLRSNLRLEERSKGATGNIYNSNYWQAKYQII